MNIVNFNFLDEISMRKRINTVNNALKAGAPYLSEIIDPQLQKMTDCEGCLASLREYAKGCYLIHIPKIQSYTIVRHFCVPDEGNIYVIAIDERGFYGFAMDSNGWAQFYIFDKNDYEKFQCEDSEFIGRTIGDIAEYFCVPLVETLCEICQ